MLKGRNGEMDDFMEISQQMEILDSDYKTEHNSFVSEFEEKQEKNDVDILQGENMRLKAEIDRLQGELKSISPEKVLEEKNRLVEKKQQLRQIYDHVKYEIKVTNLSIKEYKDKLHEISLEQKPYLEEGSKETKKIRMYENRLDKIIVQYNESVGIGLTYKNILKHLKKTKVGYANTIKSLNHGLKEKKKSHRKLSKVNLEAVKAKQKAFQELNVLKKEVNSMKSETDKILKRQKVFLKRKISKTLKKSKVLKSEEMNQRKKLAKGMMNDFTSHTKKKVSIKNYDEKFQNLKKRWDGICNQTGGTNYNEVMSKFLSLKKTSVILTENFEKKTKEIDDLNEKLKGLNEKLEKLRYDKISNFEKKKFLNDLINTEILNQKKLENLKERNFFFWQFKSQIFWSLVNIFKLLNMPKITTKMEIQFDDIFEGLDYCIENYKKIDEIGEEGGRKEGFNNRIEIKKGEPMEEEDDDDDEVLLTRDRIKEFAKISSRKKKKRKKIIKMYI